jgi:hypothetical protein
MAFDQRASGTISLPFRSLRNGYYVSRWAGHRDFSWEALMRANVALAVIFLAMPMMAAASAETAAPRATDALDDTKLVCRKTLETGSMVRKKKQCFTLREWDQIAETQRRGNQKMFDGLTEKSTGQ